MKRTFHILVLLLLILSIISGCAKIFKKKEVGTRDEFYNKTQYVVSDKIYAYAYIKDIGKKVKQVDNKIKLYFGDEIITLDNVTINEKIYYRIKAADDREYWLNKSAIVNKMFVVSAVDLACYQFPDDNSITTIKVQPGTLGIVRDTKEGWTKVEFWAYRKKTTGEQEEFIGVQWVKTNELTYLEGSDIIKEGYNLFQAYYYLFVDSAHSKEVADHFIKRGLKISAKSGQETPVTQMLQTFSKKNLQK